jgi:hypothetical protein
MAGITARFDGSRSAAGTRMNDEGGSAPLTALTMHPVAGQATRGAKVPGRAGHWLWASRCSGE